MYSTPSTPHPRTQAATLGRTSLPFPRRVSAGLARPSATRSSGKSASGAIFRRQPGAVKVPFGDGFSDSPTTAAELQSPEPHLYNRILFPIVGGMRSSIARLDPVRLPPAEGRRICMPIDLAGLVLVTSRSPSPSLGVATAPVRSFSCRVGNPQRTMFLDMYTDQPELPWKGFGGRFHDGQTCQLPSRVPHPCSSNNGPAATLRGDATRKGPGELYLSGKDRDLEPGYHGEVVRAAGLARSAVHMSGSSDATSGDQSDEEQVADSVEADVDDSAWDEAESCVFDEDEDSLLSTPLQPARCRERGGQRGDRPRRLPRTPGALPPLNPSLQRSRRSLPLHNDATPDMAMFRQGKSKRQSLTCPAEQRKRRFWTQAEERAFLNYVNQLGTAWRRILDYDAGEHGERVLQGRTNVDLKDKAVNLASVMIKYGPRLARNHAHRV